MVGWFVMMVVSWWGGSTVTGVVVAGWLIN